MRRLAIDFGTSNTVAAVAVDGQAPRTVNFGSSSLLPSAVYGGPDGIIVGREAQRQARLDPSRFEPNPKRRIDDGEVLLGDRVFPVVELISAVLRTVAGEVRRQFGGELADDVRLTHPAQWGSTRQNVLLTAARTAGLGSSIELIPEPVAAAAQFTQLPGRQLAPGQAVAIYDLGGGTFDAAVVGRTLDRTYGRMGGGAGGGPAGRFVVLAEGGLTDLGGLDLDQIVLDLLGRSAAAADPARWQAILRPTDGGTRRAARGLAEDVRAAKETLSDYQQTDVALPDPFVDVHLTRGEFEDLVRPELLRSMDTLDQTLRRAGIAPSALNGVFLVGGSSRVPLVARLIQERFQLTPIALDQPETAVALGALAVPAIGRDLRTPIGPAGHPPPTRPYLPPAPAAPGSIAPQQQQPGWAAASADRAAPRRTRRKLILGSAVLAVVLVLTLVLIVVKPFASPGVADRTSGVAGPATGRSTSVAIRPTGGGTTASSSSTTPSSTTPSITTPGTTTPGKTTPSESSSKAPTLTTLTDDEIDFAGRGFDVLACAQPGVLTGDGAVTVKREALCQLNTDLTGGSVYLIVVSLASPENVDDYLDELASISKAGKAAEDGAYTQNGVSGRELGVDQLPIEGVDYPAIAWSQSGQNFAGALAASGTITRQDLKTFWNENVGT